MMDCRLDFYFNLENYLKDLSKNNVDNFISEISNLLYDENLEILKLDDLNDRFKPSELVALCEEHNVHLNCDYYLLSNDHLHFYELNRNELFDEIVDFLNLGDYKIDELIERFDLSENIDFVKSYKEKVSFYDSAYKSIKDHPYYIQMYDSEFCVNQDFNALCKHISDTPESILNSPEKLIEFATAYMVYAYNHEEYFEECSLDESLNICKSNLEGVIEHKKFVNDVLDPVLHYLDKEATPDVLHQIKVIDDQLPKFHVLLNYGEKIAGLPENIQQILEKYNDKKIEFPKYEVYQMQQKKIEKYLSDPVLFMKKFQLLETDKMISLYNENDNRRMVGAGTAFIKAVNDNNDEKLYEVSSDFVKKTLNEPEIREFVEDWVASCVSTYSKDNCNYSFERFINVCVENKFDSATNNMKKDFHQTSKHHL